MIKKCLLPVLLLCALLLSLFIPASAIDEIPPSWLTNGTSSDSVPAADSSVSASAPAAAAAPSAEAPSGTLLITDRHVAYLTGSGGSFAPQSNLTRAEAAQILLCLLPQQPSVTASYADVPADAWYAQAAGVLGSLGVIRPGMSTFLPDEEITRGEFVHYIACFFPPRMDTTQFSDVPFGHPYAAYILTAKAYGWVTGFSDGTFRPNQTLTRAEAVAILNRALGRTPDKSYIDSTQPIFYLDVPSDSWFYYDVVEASVAHSHTAYGTEERWSSHTPTSSGLATGFYLIDGWLCYYDGALGSLARSTSVGSFDFDASGHFTTGSADLDQRLYDIVAQNTTSDMTQEQKLRALYVYTRDSFTYLRRPAYSFGATGYMQKDALNMLETGYGNCYSYSSLFWYLARWIGYDAKIYSGTVGSNKAPHGWVEIAFDGKDYIFDTELEMAYHKKGRYEINLYKYIDVDGWRYVKP